MRFLVGLAGGVIGAFFGYTAFQLGLTYFLDGDQFGVILFTMAFGLVAIALGLLLGAVGGLTLLARLRAAEPTAGIAMRLACYAAIPVALTIGMVMVLNLAWQEPGTSALESTFKTKRRSLERLVAMIQTDQIHVPVIQNENGPWTRGLSRDHIDEYLNLLQPLGTNSMVLTGDGEEIDVSVWTQGCAACGSYEKGYAYCEKVPKNLVPDIDRKLSEMPAGDISLYQYLGGKWYIFVFSD